MNKQLYRLMAAASVLALMTAVSCRKEAGAEGTAIRFGVSHDGKGLPTKTEYSGLDQDGKVLSSGSEAERIDWLATDKIRILCSQATLAGSEDKFADYQIQSISDRKSSAAIAPLAGNGLQWGTGSHDFYALYPSAVQNGRAAIAVSDGGASVSGVIPSEQSSTLSGHVCKPDMDYAYMYAYATGVTAGARVQLVFQPLVTTLEFTLLTRSEDAITSRLTSVKLSSGQKDAFLAGGFTAALTTGGLTAPAKEDITDGSNEIVVKLPDGGVGLSPTEACTVTFLALPMDQTELTLTLVFDGEPYQRKLALRYADGRWITVPACRKTYLRNLNAPKTVESFTYTLTAAAPAAHIPQAGTAQPYSVTSYKTDGVSGETTAEPWTADFSTDGGGSWSSAAPAWLTTFTASGDGSADATRYDAGASGNSTEGGWSGGTSPVAADKSAARDLSCYDIYGSKTGGVERSVPYNTANCYVVSAPGWYCLPCVYGNAIKEGGDNTDAYRKGKADETSIMGAFKNHAGKGIVAPWIKDNSISISSAELVWQDVQGMISDVSFDTDYVYFYVDPQHIGQGNAVMAAKSGSTVVWSWHIWVMDNPSVKLKTKAVYAHPTVNTSIVNPNDMLSMNLGFCEASIAERSVLVRFTQTRSGETAVITITQSGGTNFNNPYYQWGRKDPMFPSGGGYATKKVYNGSGTVIASMQYTKGSTVANGICNPATFLYRVDNLNNWSTARYDNLWNYNQTTALKNGEDAGDLAVGKTVYDPCPPGFKVPNYHAFSGFSTSGNQTWTEVSASNTDSFETDMGYYFYTNLSDHEAGDIFFPATGCRDGSNYGSLDEVMETGYNWTAAPVYVSRYYGRYLAFYNSHVGPVNYAMRANGNAVRPVRE